ncbi:MAG TPA: pyridoxal phosphate-dependent aminotransferase [Longimicrobiaceae bacterium]|jgi:aspartate/methionine/tyrosine aminotransferase|nr:pyridoxal phosphate-dependent aminotransferase [Longimicrobiaceae bacterium]
MERRRISIAPPVIPGFRAVPFTGVIYVMSEAQRLGYSYGNPEWCNLGQGMPETGELPGAPPRKCTVEITPADQEYAPVAGIPELRTAVADLYNQLYRQGMSSQYTADNVCICGGGRLSLARTVAALGEINLGHFLPDYTAYEELLDIFRLFTSIPILLDGDEGYAFDSRALAREITGRGLSAVLLSNPSNPTGKTIQGKELARWVALARKLQCTLLFDEFYSHYVWGGDEPDGLVSAARYVKDVDRDPVLLLDGFTKNWRYPGWRCTWVVGPRSVIEGVSSTGSFLDGGGNRPLQRAAVPLLEIEAVLAETAAIRETFGRKRGVLLEALREAGMRFDVEPEGTFYVWADLSRLPAPLNDGMGFFRAALEEKVICVPGEFFDINPGKRRSGRPSRFRQYARFSFGPEESQVAEGARRIVEMVRRAG